MRQFLATNDAWVIKQIATQAANSDFWAAVGWLYRQLDGMTAGYNAHRLASEPELTRLDFSLINTQGDPYKTKENMEYKYVFSHIIFLFDFLHDFLHG